MVSPHSRNTPDDLTMNETNMTETISGTISGTVSEAVLSTRNLCMEYEGRPLLDNISFRLNQGELLCLLGPSGSGKTTLLRIIAGLEQTNGGEISFAGANLEQTAPHKRQFGMMFQEYALFPHKTVAENVAFGLQMNKQSKAHITERTTEMLELVGLQDYGTRRIDELSGGERQRVALARSLAPRPRLLLLDEPFASLDRGLRERLAEEVRSILKKLGVTAIFVTHDQSEAFAVADKIGVLYNGCLQQFASPENLYRFPANRIVARFLGLTNIIEHSQTGSKDSPQKAANQSQLYDRLLPFAQHPQHDGQQTSRSSLHSRGTSSSAPSFPITKKAILIRPEGARLYSQELNREVNQEVNQKVKIDSPADPLLLSGTLTVRRFQGQNYRLTVATEDGNLTFVLPLDPQPPQTGERLSLQLLPSSLVLLDQEEENQ